MMLSLLLSLPGSPFLYYGDELGMGDDLDLPDRDGVRTPMQWDATVNGGFSTAESLFAPAIIDPIYGYKTLNVEKQESDPDSLLRWTRQAIAVRNRHQAFGRGSTEWLNATDTAVLSFRLTHRDEVMFVAVNLADRPADVELPTGIDALTAAPVEGRTTLEPYGYRWVVES